MVEKNKKKKSSKPKESAQPALAKKAARPADGAKTNEPKAWTMQVLPPRSIIRTNNHKYVILKPLGHGGFGDVYSVKRKSDGVLMAAKVEWTKKVEEPRLMREYEIYQEINQLKESNPSAVENLLRCNDVGGVPDVCYFLFLPLLGPSLKDLLGVRTPSYQTAIQITVQTLRSIKNFHALGRIHRDIKPANFAIGHKEESNTVFLIDFGMAVRFCTDPSKMPTSSAYQFIGTRCYASRTTHNEKPQTRRDDLESWFYVCLELFKRGILPWANEQEPMVRHLKDNLFEKLPSTIFSQVPSCFEQFASMIDEIGNYSTPNYDFFFELLNNLAQERDLALDAPFEWLGKNANVEAPRVARCEISFGAKNGKPTAFVEQPRTPKTKGAKKKSTDQSSSTLPPTTSVYSTPSSHRPVTSTRSEIGTPSAMSVPTFIPIPKNMKVEKTKEKTDG
ncbi:Protein kinase domain-containing protein [Aphelenchoides besseyi]|nr:Protein kinase domain-containing protein [Aphelenchoides besseyi]